MTEKSVKRARKYLSLAQFFLVTAIISIFFSFIFPSIIVKLLPFIFIVLALMFLSKNETFLKKDKTNFKKRIIELEMENCEIQSFMERLMKCGTELISEMEKDALIKKIRDSFGGLTKASAGYLLLYNQNQNSYEWGIGHNLSQIKLKSPSIKASDSLMGKVLSDTSSAVQFLDVESLRRDGSLHVKEGIIESLDPLPEVLLAIRLQMKSSNLGVQFLFITKMQADDFQKNISIFNGLVNMATLALGSAIQREFAINDRMTMMYNHEYFVNRLRDEIAMCRRSNNRKLSILMMDIDKFKNFNDTYGHQIGDFVLIQSSRIYKESVRMTDIVARYGGEEFAIILPDTDGADAVKVAEKIRTNIEKTIYKTEKGDLHVTISIGVAEWKADHNPPFNEESLVKLADDKLYVCKENGRNCVTI